MAQSLSFAGEITNLLYGAEPNPVEACIQCGTCSGSCPVVTFMDHSPRQLIAMIRAGQRQAVEQSTAFWTCASCYQCTVRCPAGIDIANLMYGLKRYTVWRRSHEPRLIGPGFSRRFMRMIVRTGRSWEPALAPAYLGRSGLRSTIAEIRMATALVLRGRLPLVPRWIKARRGLRAMLRHIVPVGGRA